MVLVSISETHHLHPAWRKHSGGARGLEEMEERWLSSCLQEIIGTSLLLVVVHGRGHQHSSKSHCKVAVEAPRSWEALLHPFTSLRNAGGTLRPLLGPVAAVRVVETGFKRNPTRNSYGASQGLSTDSLGSAGAPHLCVRSALM